MSTLDALLTREAREQRGLLAALLLAGPGLVVAAQGVFLDGDPDAAELTLSLLVPAVLSLLLAALTLESLCREVGAGAGERLGNLPVGSGRLLLAKGLWLASAAILLTALTLLMEGIVSTWRGGAPAAMELRHWGADALWWGGAGLLASLLLWGWALMLGRPLLAGAAWLATLAGLGLLARAWGQDLLNQVEVVPLPLLLLLPCLAFALAAARAWRPGLVLPREAGQRLAAGIGALALVAGSLGAVQAWGAEGRMDVAIGEGRIAMAGVSPDGRWALLALEGPVRALGGGEFFVQQDYYLRVDGGEVRPELPASWEQSVARRSSIFDVTREGRHANEYMLTDPGGRFELWARFGFSGGQIQDRSTGAVAAILPAGWMIENWGQGPEVWAIARPVQGPEFGTLVRRVLGPSGWRRVQLEQPGILWALEGGELLQRRAKSLVVLGPDGELQRTLYPLPD